MTIEVMLSDRPHLGRYMADCKDMPGSPPLGFGNTHAEAVGDLVILLCGSQVYKELFFKELNFKFPKG